MIEKANSFLFYLWISTAGYPGILGLMAMLIMITPAVGQGSDLSRLLSGKDYPLTVKLKDLNEEWRRVTVLGSASVSGNVSVNMGGSTAGSTSQNNNVIGPLGGSRTYVTKGQTVSANAHTFLVAYHLPGGGLDLSMVLQAAATKMPPATAILTPETSLQLSLLDMGAISALENVRVFDLNWEISESEKAAKMIGNLLKGEEGGKSTNPPPSGSR